MSAPPLLVLRADASARMGTGHVMRALALAQAWRDAGNQAVLAAASLPDGVAALVERDGVEVARLAGAAGSAADAGETAALAAERGASWVAADGYALGVGWQRRVRRAARLLVVDDDAIIGEYDADMVLDQNLGASEERYAALAPGARRLMGPRYALLRREFRHRARDHGGAGAVRERPREERAPRLLVTLGGSDPARLTERVLRALARPGLPALEVRVVVGAANERLSGLRLMAGSLAGAHCVEVLVSVSDMPALMEWADLALSAAGSTSWELAYMGVPMVLIVAADNQARIAGQLAATGAAVSLGESSGLEEEAIARAVGELVESGRARAELSRRARSLVDGLGAERVVEALARQRE